jgi:hypothetical protein
MRAERRRRRFLALANRAASFTTLARSAEAAVTRSVAEEREAELAHGQARTHEAFSHWRAQGAAHRFRPEDDHLHRLYHRYLRSQEAALADRSRAADAEHEQMRAALESEMSRRDGLQRALDTSLDRLKGERQRQMQKEVDDTWNVLRNGRRHEDR